MSQKEIEKLDNLISVFTEKMESIKVSQIRQEEHTKAIDNHLSQLNSKVASNIKNIERNRLLVVTESELKKDIFNNALKESIHPLAEKVSTCEMEIFSGKRILYAAMAVSAMLGVLLYGYFQYTISEEIENQFQNLKSSIIQDA